MWNCRGFGRSSAVRGLYGLVRKHSPGGLFLCEIKAHKDKIEFIRRKLSFDNSFVVEADNKKGGLALLWNNCWNWSIILVSKWIIEVLVESDQRQKWIAWFYHCLVERMLRRAFWEDLTSKVISRLNSWICLGDLNDVLDQNEKVGGRLATYKSNLFLRTFVGTVGAVDIGFYGNKCTWCNKRRGLANIREQLGKVLASTD